MGILPREYTLVSVGKTSWFSLETQGLRTLKGLAFSLIDTACSVAFYHDNVQFRSSGRMKAVALGMTPR